MSLVLTSHGGTDFSVYITTWVIESSANAQWCAKAQMRPIVQTNLRMPHVWRFSPFLSFVFQAVFYEYSTAAEAYAYRPAIQNEKKRWEYNLTIYTTEIEV